MGQIEALVSALQQHVPTADVISNIDTLREYAIDGVIPRLVVTPTGVEEIARTVALVNQYDLTLLARGNGSRMNLGGLPELIDVLINTSGAKRLLEHEGPDLTCHVEAGMTLAELQAQLASKGQRLALDPPNAEQTTIGGLLASNASGPKRLRYGSARDQVIGLRVVQASGEIARSGGRVVKNVAGYDLNKLYIGSLGTLGIIVEANFKLQPIPAAERTLLLSYTSCEDAMHTIAAINGSQLTPGALELIDARAASAMVELSGFTIPTNGYTLAVNFEGSQTMIQRQVDETYLIARKHNALMSDDLEGARQDQFWHAVRKHMQGTLTCKIAILVSQLAAYVHHLEDICSRYDLEAAVVAHAGNGILYVELRPGDALPRLTQGITEMRQRALQARGSLVIERCPVELKRHLNVWGEPGADFRFMQRLKEQFDPKGTFARGRFLGGL